MMRFIHSLRFQLPAVLLGLFVLILGLWVLLFREVSTITGKTLELNLSTEVSDGVTEWSNHVATAARERTKFMTLSKEDYLESFLNSAKSFDSIYAGIKALTLPGSSESLHKLAGFHDLNLEYQSRSESYAWEWRSGETLRAQLLEKMRRPLPIEIPAPPETGKKKTGKTKKASGKAKVQSKPRSRAPSPALLSARKARTEAANALEDFYRRKRFRDSVATAHFKVLEARLREGLQEIQGDLRQERMEKQNSLRATIAYAKQRLIYSLILLTLMVGYVAYILQWKILEPIRRLEYGAIQIGRGFLGFRVEVENKSEIGDLAKVLNTMSEKLAKHREGEMRLKRLDAIQQVVRSVNHEINNPLMIISGNAEYLLTILESQDDAVKEKLNTIIAEVRRIFFVTQQLKEIKELVTSNYTSEEDKMIDLARSTQVIRRAW